MVYDGHHNHHVLLFSFKGSLKNQLLIALSAEIKKEKVSTLQQIDFFENLGELAQLHFVVQA